MNKNIGLWQLFGFALVSLLGSLLHFLYNWTNSGLAALFSSVNESTWEHMKLLFFPTFLFAAVQSFFVGKTSPAFWCIKLKGTLLGLALIPILFYTINGAFGKTPDWINIAIFFIAAGAAFIYETKLFKSEVTGCGNPKSALAALCLIAVLFWIFTFYPPEIPLFTDPIDGSFGI